MEDISGFGIVLTVVASNTFPVGFNVSQFADDADPMDLPAITINDAAMGVNGDLITWSKAVPIKMTIGVIAGSEDDQNLAALLEANRTGRGKVGARDIITITAVYPSGNTLTVGQGKILEGMPGSSVASAGRLKTKTYGFAFENRVGLGS